MKCYEGKWLICEMCWDMGESVIVWHIDGSCCTHFSDWDYCKFCCIKYIWLQCSLYVNYVIIDMYALQSGFAVHLIVRKINVIVRWGSSLWRVLFVWYSFHPFIRSCYTLVKLDIGAHSSCLRQPTFIRSCYTLVILDIRVRFFLSKAAYILTVHHSSM